MDDKYIEELFALPIGLEVEAVVDGQKFYSSQKLKESFLKSMGASGRSSQIYNQIESLVMKKRLLVPCYLSKNMFRFFVHKILGNPEDKSVLGFYHMGQKRVFILIDNTISPVGTAENDFLASTTIHECVHLYADRMKGKFLKTFFPELERFYISYLSRVFQVKRKPNVSEIVKFISNFEYQRSEQMNKQLANYYYLLEKELKSISDLNETQFDNMLRGLVVSIKLSLINFSVFIRMYRQYINIYGPLDRAYQEAFGSRNTYTTPYQELSSVSEVICVLSEMKPTYPKIKKMFKDMA
jgi:hypothetical protein